ncbi:DMT family transporter [Puniceicoccaceae bacterium K14]|nr:DMT family transporter [Puniceicoccaceae bacterium K14]
MHLKSVLIPMLCVISGSAIALQSSLSAQLSRRIGSPVLSSASVFLIGFLVLMSFLMVSRDRLPAWELIRETPRHLWIVGGILSACALSCVYWIMPQIGVARTMLLLLMGQLLTSAIVGHLGLFALPENSLSGQRLLALTLVGAGVVLFTFSNGD